MRKEIKFRGQENENKKWVYGFYQEYPKGYVHIQNEYNDWFPILPDTVGQYIGVDDKNGKEIYEDDIVLIDGEDEYFVVERDSDTARFVMNSETLTVDFDNYWGYQVEVIGNVRENADLLKGENYGKGN